MLALSDSCGSPWQMSYALGSSDILGSPLKLGFHLHSSTQPPVHRDYNPDTGYLASAALHDPCIFVFKTNTKYTKLTTLLSSAASSRCNQAPGTTQYADLEDILSWEVVLKEQGTLSG